VRGGRFVTNIVMMGIGEPLYNFRMPVATRCSSCRTAMVSAFPPSHHALDRRAWCDIRRAGEEIGVMLAISLHAVRDELRDELSR